MPIDRLALTRNFVAAMHDRQAALFVGAGISRSAGFLDWRGLLRECACEIGLDLDRETDLVAVAQYYLNRRMWDRARLNDIVKQEFAKVAKFTANHAIIGRLPVDTVWTTNFDALLEDAFGRASRTVDVKLRDEDIPYSRTGRDVVLYKMHGDIAHPEQVVICKDDYERYARLHPILQSTLESDLLNRTFLFIGFSFSDPNLTYMLGHLNSLLGSRRQHYAIMRRARLDQHQSDTAAANRRCRYDLNKQQLQVEDLQRYSIQTLLVDEYAEVTDVLADIERAYNQRSIFVSGSANKFGEFGEDRLRDLCMRFGERLVETDRRLISGMGLYVGDAVVKGAMLKLHELGHSSIENVLFLRPFPRNLPAAISELEFNDRYRRDMIRRCGFAVFIAGTSGTAEESAGVLQEFAIARELGKIPIPIGATGFAARRIWETLAPDVQTVYKGTVSDVQFARLNDAQLSNPQLISAAFKIMTAAATIQSSDPVAHQESAL